MELSLQKLAGHAGFDHWHFLGGEVVGGVLAASMERQVGSIGQSNPVFPSRAGQCRPVHHRVRLWNKDQFGGWTEQAEQDGPDDWR